MISGDIVHSGGIVTYIYNLAGLKVKESNLCLHLIRAVDADKLEVRNNASSVWFMHTEFSCRDMTRYRVLLTAGGK